MHSRGSSARPTTLHREPTPHYQTVPASPQRAAETAREEHEKALKLLDHLNAGPKRIARAEDHLQRALVADVTYGPAHNSLGMLLLSAA